MDYTFSRHVTDYTISTEKKSILSSFFDWATNEDEEHHIGWVGISVIAMTAIFFPVTMCAVLLNGAVFGLIIAAGISLSLVVVANLAAMPTKFTIPLFALGILMDAVIIIASFFI